MTGPTQYYNANVEAILSWHSDPIVARYSSTSGQSRDDSLACFEAWKQFMAVNAIRGTGNSVPSRPVDDMWHTALVFTEVYRDFCATYVGRFIDHNPHEHSDPDGYFATRDVAAELFGELDPRFWTDDSAACADCT